MSVSSKVQLVCREPVERRKTPSKMRMSARQNACSVRRHCGLAFGLPPREGERQRDSHQKRERRLDEVVQRATDPRDVGLLLREECPERIAGQGIGDAPQVQHLGHHQQHYEAAIGIDRTDARERGAGRDRCGCGDAFACYG